MALLLTFLCGVFFLVGIVCFNFVSDKKFLSLMSLSCASIVIVGLVLFDLLPELIEMRSLWNILFVVMGLVLLSVIDKFVPHHKHEHHEDDEEGLEHKGHLEHISFVTILALLLHNFIEGMALFGVASGDIKSGFLMMIGIGLHNLPFGFQIATFNKDDIKYKVMIFLLVISGFLGAVVISIFGDLSTYVEGVIISLTLGMLIYIFINELFREVVQNIGKKETIYGIIIGVVLLILISLF